MTVVLFRPHKGMKITRARWRSLAARVRFRSDVIVVCALLRAPGSPIGVGDDEGGWPSGRAVFG